MSIIIDTPLRHRYFSPIILYGFGLTLLLWLGFKAFLLYQQSHPQGMYEYDPARQADQDSLVLQQQLPACSRANQQKDSLSHYLEQAAHPPPAPEGVQSAPTN